MDPYNYTVPEDYYRQAQPRALAGGFRQHPAPQPYYNTAYNYPVYQGQPNGSYAPMYHNPNLPNAYDNHERPARDAERTVRQAPPPVTIQLGGTTYTVVRVIEEPAASHSMSNGVRVLKDVQGKVFVEKRLRMADQENKDRANAEMEALKQIEQGGGSMFINRLVEAVWTSGSSHSSLVLEYCDQGTLAGYISIERTQRQMVDEAFCWHVLKQLSSALAMCHNGIRDVTQSNNRPSTWNTICHLDIKGTNVFLSSKKAPGHENDPWPTIVLGDFGCAVTRTDFNQGKVSSSCQPFGTPGWFPPEAEAGAVSVRAVYGKHTDIWQLGGMIQVLCQLSDQPDKSLVEADNPCGITYSNELDSTVLNCMAKRPDKRPSAMDVVRRVRDVVG